MSVQRFNARNHSLNKITATLIVPIHEQTSFLVN